MKALKESITQVVEEKDTKEEMTCDIIQSKKRDAERMLNALYDEWQENFRTDLALSLHYKDEAAQATFKVIERKEQENITIEAAEFRERFIRLNKCELDRREKFFHDTHKRLISEVKDEVELQSSVRLTEAIEAHKQSLRDL